MVAEEVRGKGKRGLLRIIFGRTTFFILFMALQIAVLAWIYFWLDDRYQAYGYGAFGLVSAILAIRILNEKQNASFKMAWLVPVLLFPVFGCLFYIFVQLQMETKILAKRIADIRIRTRSYLNQNEAIAAKLMKENRRNANLSRYLSERAGYPVYDKTNFKYYPLGDDFFPDLLEELKAAERFIFLEYFIIQRGRLRFRCAGKVARSARHPFLLRHPRRRRPRGRGLLCPGKRALRQCVRRPHQAGLCAAEPEGAGKHRDGAGRISYNF